MKFINNSLILQFYIFSDSNAAMLTWHSLKPHKAAYLVFRKHRQTKSAIRKAKNLKSMFSLKLNIVLLLFCAYV